MAQAVESDSPADRKKIMKELRRRQREFVPQQAAIMGNWQTVPGYTTGSNVLWSGTTGSNTTYTNVANIPN